MMESESRKAKKAASAAGHGWLRTYEKGAKSCKTLLKDELPGDCTVIIVKYFVEEVKSNFYKLYYLPPS